MLTDGQLDAIKANNAVSEVAAGYVKLRRGSSKYGRAGFTGPCPKCSSDTQKKTATKFECNSDEWICAVCGIRGDVIRLVQEAEGIDFLAAVERLGGTRQAEITPAVADRRGRAAFESGVALDACPAEYAGEIASAWAAGWRAAKLAADRQAQYRERERLRLLGFWDEAADIAGTPVEHYHAGRGLLCPPNARLRYHPAMPLFADGKEKTRRLHIGPAQLAAIWQPLADQPGKVRFSGLHITWLDPCGPKGKAHVIDPETGEAAPSKKVRGSKAGGFINLGGAPMPERAFPNMIAGEGIETVLAAYTAQVRGGEDVAGTLYRSGVDLGNLCGRASDRLQHPTAVENGRRRRVGGPTPDLASPAMPVPEAITNLIGLGDGDSDAFETINALARFKARHARPGRTVRTPFAPAGADFNDALQKEGER